MSMNDITAEQFQSTLPYGSDNSIADAERLAKKFQSTLPYGSDLPSSLYASRSAYFNPRSLTGATSATSSKVIPP